MISRVLSSFFPSDRKHAERGLSSRQITLLTRTPASRAQFVIFTEWIPDKSRTPSRFIGRLRRQLSTVREPSIRDGYRVVVGDYLPAARTSRETRNIDAWVNTGRYWTETFSTQPARSIIRSGKRWRKSKRGQGERFIAVCKVVFLALWAGTRLFYATLSWNLPRYPCDIRFTRINRSERFIPNDNEP